MRIILLENMLDKREMVWSKFDQYTVENLETDRKKHLLTIPLSKSALLSPQLLGNQAAPET